MAGASGSDAGAGGQTSDAGASGTGGASEAGAGGSDTGQAGETSGGGSGTGGSDAGAGGSTAGAGGGDAGSGGAAEGGAGGVSGSSGQAGAGAGGAAGGAGGSTAGAGGSDAGSGGTAGAVGVPVILVGEITGATDDEVIMIQEGIALANTTMATPCFKEFVLAASWTETEGLTQEQIYEKLASGPVQVNIDMFMGTWVQNHVYKTIGYEDEPGTVHMNRYFVDTPYMVASNAIHEAEGHSQGFSHYGVKSTSVPYGLNDAFEACSPVDP